MKPVPSFLVPAHGHRLLAFMIDEAMRWFFLAPAIGLMGIAAVMAEPGSYLMLKVFTLVALLSLGFRTFCLYFIGATPGKLLCGLQVNPREGGEDLTLMQALVRSLADELGIFLLYIPRAMLFFRLDRTQFSDWVAETRVVQKRGGVLPVKRSTGLGLTLILIAVLLSMES